MTSFRTAEPLSAETPHRLEFGGRDGEFPRFEMTAQVVRVWDDPQTNGIPPVELMSVVCGPPRKPWRYARRNGIDAVVLNQAKPDHQAPATHVLIGRQIFLNHELEVVTCPEGSRGSHDLAVRILYAGEEFFLQSVSHDLQLTVNGLMAQLYELRPLVPGMKLLFRLKSGREVLAEWHHPVFQT
ncbi:MAG: hypothetical protein KDA85_01390 [Planctomycetaceae bacterium]|nr:hypothetical protein [Planctomycetaceae bacterium]